MQSQLIALKFFTSPTKIYPKAIGMHDLNLTQIESQNSAYNHR